MLFLLGPTTKDEISAGSTLILASSSHFLAVLFSALGAILKGLRFLKNFSESSSTRTVTSLLVRMVLPLHLGTNTRFRPAD